MYSIKKKEDINQIKKYHRAKDMVNIQLYFPGLSPVDDLAIVTDEEDYLSHQKELKDLTSIRNGNPITEPCMESIPVREDHPDIIDVIKKVKEINPKGVVILFHLNTKKTERYEREAGISVGISLGNKVYIDAVGHGFDGREVLKGISCHERYTIPWNELRRVNQDNFKEYRTYLINPSQYLETRKERINYLISCGLEKEKIEENIPKEYQEIPDYIWLSIIKDILKVLEKEEDVLRKAGFYEFNISGHTEGRYFAPWQMVDDKRM